MLRYKLGLGVVTICLLSAVSFADWSNHFLDGNASAMTGFTGSQEFYSHGLNQNNLIKTLEITVDYAVFAPGAFNDIGGVFSQIPGSTDPFNFDPATNYVYAYQIYNPGASTGGESNSLLRSLGINTPSITAIGYDPNMDPSPDAFAPLSGYYTGTGVTFYFNPKLNYDTFSTVVLISSTTAPQYQLASVLDSGLTDSELLPAPSHNPIPGSVLIGAMGLGILGYIKRRHGAAFQN